jgi:hypothetical protein
VSNDVPSVGSFSKNPLRIYIFVCFLNLFVIFTSFLHLKKVISEIKSCAEISFLSLASQPHGIPGSSNSSNSTVSVLQGFQTVFGARPTTS